MAKVAYHDPSKMEEVMCYDKMMDTFEPICLKASHYGESDIVVETVQLLDVRLEERHAMKTTLNGKVARTPSSVGNNIIKKQDTGLCL